MSGALAAAMAVLFNDPHGSEAAVLCRRDRLEQPLRVLRRGTVSEGEVGVSNTSSVGTTFEVQRSACPEKPGGAGDDGRFQTVLRVAGQSWGVFNVEEDTRKGVWLLACQPA